MEPNFIQEKLNKAEKAMEDAKKEYEEAKEAFIDHWKKKNPAGSKAEMLDYLETKLKRYAAAVESSQELYKILVETYQKTMEKMTLPPSDHLLKVIDRIEELKPSIQDLKQEQIILANHIVPFIEELKLEQFALAASSEKSNNQAVKIDCINYYNNTTLTSLPTTITCQFLGIDFATSQVTCSHIFQRKWAKSRKIIDLQEINDVKNLLLLFKPIEVAFDEGRICFLWNNSDSQFQMKILDPAIRNETVLDLTLRQFPSFPTTKIDPVLMNTIAALEGRPLKTGKAIPYKRCLAFHASRARYEAIHIQKWIKAEDFIISEDAWSPNILETPELKSQIELWLNQD
jgi:archaellum component FlaC